MRFSARRWRAPEYEAPGRGPIPSNATWRDICLSYVLPWLGGKLFSLGWTFVSAVASYSPFLLMTLVENKMDEHRWKTIAQRQMRAREDFAIEEFSAYKDGDEVDQYVEEEGEKEGDVEDEEKEEEEEEEEKEEEEGEEENRKGKVFVFILKSTVGYLPMMLLRVISRKINERTAVMSAQHQREYAQQLASRMRGGGPGGPRPQQPVGTHYQPPYYYNEPAYGKEIFSGLDITYE